MSLSDCHVARHLRVALLACLAVWACLGWTGCSTRSYTIEQNALMPIPAATRMNGPLAPAGKWQVQGDVAHGVVPTATAEARDSRTAGHTAVNTLLRGGLSRGLSETLEWSLWADYGHRGLSAPTAVGLKPGDLNEKHSFWLGMSFRKAWPMKDGGARMSWDLGVGRVPWTRFVTVTDDVLVERSWGTGSSDGRVGPEDVDIFRNAGWVQFENGYIRRSSSMLARTALFFDVTMAASTHGHFHMGLGWQVIPYAPSVVKASFNCDSQAMPDERDRTCATDLDVDVFESAVLTTLTTGIDWDFDAWIWTLDAWLHLTDFGTGAATAPFGFAVGTRF